MAWSQWPIVNSPTVASGIPGSGTDIQYYNWLTQIWRAVWERQWCLTGSISQTIVGSGGFTWTTPEIVPQPSRTNVVWAGGTITAMSGSGRTWLFTDSSKAMPPSGQPDDGHWWNGQQRPTGCSYNYWVSLDCTDDPPDLPYLPANYDVIIEYDNGEEEWYRDIQPWQIVRGSMISSTSQTFTLDVRLDNYVTAGVIPSTDLVGKRYYIIKTGGLWWADKDFEFGRYPDWPNTEEKWKGTVDAGKMFVGGSGYLFEELNDIKEDPYNIPFNYRIHWDRDKWQNKSVIVYDSNQVLHRLTPSSSNENTIFFGGLDFIPPASGEPAIDYTLVNEYIIIGPSGVDTNQPLSNGIPASGMGWPDRQFMPMTWWYGGAHKDIYYHDPSDTIGVNHKSFADDSVTWEELETTFEVACGDPESQHTENDHLDRDVWSSVTNMCDPADFNFSPHLNKTLRSMQAAIESAIPFFVRPIDYDGLKDIPNYSPAQCFADCGINAGSGTVITPAPGGSYTFAVPSGYNNASLFYETVRNGVRTAVGSVAVNASGIATVGAASSGSSVVYSAGWTRYYPREFTNLYQRSCFVPDIKDEEGIQTAIYPPEIDDFGETGCFGVGTWHSRSPSSGYKYYSSFGYSQDNITGFVPGDVARYVGDNWADPGTTVTYDSEEYSPDLEYWDRMYEGNHPRQTELMLLSQRKGIVSSGTHYSLTDEGKNWWQYWYSLENHAGPGVLRQEFGSGVGGSSTTIELERKFTDTSGEFHCFWQANRFIGPQFDSVPYRSFTIEIDKPVTSGTVTYKMPITNVTNLGEDQEPIVHFAAPDGTFNVQRGWNWRINEPASNLNRYRGKRVIITTPSGTRTELEITHNDHNTLFFSPQPNKIPVGSKYQIIEYHTGGTWMFQSTEPSGAQKAGGPWQKIGPNGYWVQPSGIDPRGMPWHTDNTENLPHKTYRGFGKIHKGDYIYYDTFDEMYKVLNKLVWTQKGYSWESRGENNAKGASQFSDGSLFNPDVQPIDTWTEAAIGAEGVCEGGTDFTGVNEIYNTADWNIVCGDPDYFEGTSTDPPHALLETYEQHEGAVNSNEYVSALAAINGAYQYADITGIPSLIASAVDWYAYAQINAANSDEGIINEDQLETPDGGYAETKFNGLGYNLYFRAWGKWATSAVSKLGARETTEALGQIVEGNTFTPPASTDITDGPASAGIIEGFWVSNKTAVIKWNVAGGLRYVDWQA